MYNLPVARFGLILLLLIAAFQPASSQGSLNVTLESNLSTIGSANDCWGWWDSQGNEYAIVGRRPGGVAVINITNQANPVLLDTTVGVPSIWRDIKSFQDYVYIVNDNGGFGGFGLQIIDMSALPNLVYKDTIINGMETAHNIYIDNGYAYVVGCNNNQGVTIYDLNQDPWNPVEVGRYTTHYVHDIYVRNDTGYCAELRQGLTIIDFSDKANPQVIGNKQYIDNFTHNTWLSDDGNTCYTTDETGGGFIYSWDVSDPQNITLLDDYRSLQGSPEFSVIPHNAHVLNDFVVNSYYRDGMTIVDGNIPYNIVEVGYYDTSPQSGFGGEGCWGAFPYFPSGACIASDRQLGLFVFNVNYQRASYLEGDITDASTNFPILGATVTVQNEIWGATSDNIGFYATGTDSAGSYTVTYSAFGYQDSTLIVAISSGNITTQDIALQPLPTVDAVIEVIDSVSGLAVPFAKVELNENSGLVSFSYTADSNGFVNASQIIQGSYSLQAGSWGWEAVEVPVTVGSAGDSLVVEIGEGYKDEFALDLGWTMTSTASDGAWERGDPEGTFYLNQRSQPEYDLQNDIGAECFATGISGGAIGDNDLDDGITTLTSPPMDMSSFQDPVIYFNRWFFNLGGSGPGNDTLTIEISNGTTTAIFKKISVTANAWIRDTIEVSNFLSPNDSVTVTFTVGDYNAGHTVEAAVDGFEAIDNAQVSISEFLNGPEIDLTIFPNPVGNTATICYNLGTSREENTIFEIIDLTGRVLYEIPIRSISGEFQFDTSFSEGMYFGRLRDVNGTLKVVRILK